MQFSSNKSQWLSEFLNRIEVRVEEKLMRWGCTRRSSRSNEEMMGSGGWVSHRAAEHIERIKHGLEPGLAALQFRAILLRVQPHSAECTAEGLGFSVKG
jgi:hypothetical protein